jgi:hypothetical protein
MTTMNLLNLSAKRKNKEVLKQELKNMNRIRTGVRKRLSVEEKQILKEKANTEKEKFEKGNLGRYVLIYPHPKTKDKYTELFKAS